MNHKVAYLGVCTALGLVLSYVETLIPVFIAVPGMKLGLANLIVVILLYGVGPREAYTVSVLRVILVGFMFGNMASIIYSLAGCSLSFLVMLLLYRREGFTILGVSVAGAVFHNLGQIIVAMLIVETFSIIYYFPILMVSGVVTGLVIGIISKEVLKRLPKMGEY